MKKLLPLFLTTVMLISITACNETGNASDTEETTNATTITTTSDETTISSVDSIELNSKYEILNLYGDIVDLQDADSLWRISDDRFGFTSISKEEAIELDIYFARFINYTYMDKSIGISYNSLTDSYDKERKVFDVDVPEQKYERFKIFTGDIFETLTVKEVFIEYQVLNGVAYPNELSVAFSGDLTITGYITSILETELLYGKGDIVFLPNANTWGDVPIFLNHGNDWLPKVTAIIEEVHYSSDISPVWLGNIDEEYGDIDIDDIPRDSSFKLVEITITNLEMHMHFSGSSDGYSGKILNVSLL